MPTIGLAMIIRDEASIITRALDSVRPLVDYLLIEDTGSTDGTQKIVADWLARNSNPGKLTEHVWQNFGYNRSHVLAELRKVDVDYALMFEADEILQLNSSEPNALKQQLTADCYYIDLHLRSIVYPMPRLTKNKLPFFYCGVVHEWLACEPNSFSRASLTDVIIHSIGGGVRGRTPDRYRHDAKLLEDELKRNNLNALERARNTFYLAQSWRDADEPQRALDTYWQRVGLGGWTEEVYISLLNIARLHERLERPFTQIVDAYKRAIALNPKRAEAIHGLVKVYRLADMFHEGYALAERGIKLPLHKGLFVETWIYEYGLLDEFSICAYYAGHKTVSWLAAQMLLRGNLDDVTRERVDKNAEFARN